MHQDKKREELEQKMEFEQLQQEELLEEKESEEIQQENKPEEKIEDEPIENEIERSKRKRRELIFEFALFFVLGVLLGVTIKTEAVKKITIGFSDYQLEKVSSSYDIESMKTVFKQKAAQQQIEQGQQQQLNQ